ncbi:hypothetical protein JW935_04305, partial [candidate division KSB1 bacterium]|nr:hypothetical protein [candidate division KSB1 bacterium]
MAIIKFKQWGMYRFLFVLCLFALTPVRANFLGRTFEPVIITNVEDPSTPGSLLRMPEFNGLALNRIKVYAYSATAGWRLIPFQIDNVPHFDENDDVFDGNDEIVFIAKDCGEWAPAGQWVGDVSSLNYPRYQVSVFDPLSGKTGYVYIYATDNPEWHSEPESYFVRYDAATDNIISNYYELGAGGPVDNGNVGRVVIPESAGGMGLDFVDVLKVRLAGSVPLLGRDVILDENDLQRGESAPRVITGPVRYIRKWYLKLYYEIAPGIAYDANFDVTLQYFPYFFGFKLPIPELDQSYVKVNYARISLDLGGALKDCDCVTQMFSSIMGDWPEKYQNGVTIDNTNDPDLLPRALMAPGYNWWMQTGDLGTILTVSDISKIGSKQELYYKDSPSGTNDPAAYDGGDTGDNTSWGDTGVKFTDNISGQINLAANYYFLGAHIPPDSAEKIMQQMANPLAKPVVSGPIHVPVELAFFSARTVDSMVQMTWLTASETNNLGFSLQRRQTGTDWQVIAFIKGAGTTTRAQSYSYSDSPGTAGEYFYRLKQTDLDG